MTCILHVGLPKTGSTALQQALYRNRASLAAQGVLYDPLIHAEADPKHQWTIAALRNASALQQQDFARFHGRGRVIISSESIANELPMLDDGAIDAFQGRLHAVGPLTIAVVFRQPESWAKSYYKQAIANQPSNSLDFYNASTTFADFTSHPHVAYLMDQKAVCADLAAKFRATVRKFRYEETSVRAIAETISGVALPEADWSAAPINESLDDLTAEALRQINGSVHTLQQKQAWAFVFARAVDTGSAVIQVLARKARRADIAALDLRLLEDLKYEPNPPLSIEKAAFADMRDRLLWTAEAAKAALEHR